MIAYTSTGWKSESQAAEIFSLFSDSTIHTFLAPTVQRGPVLKKHSNSQFAGTLAASAS